MLNPNHSNTTPASPLEAVIRQFEHWRVTRGKRGRIPDALWALVVPLMDQYTHIEIASALRLNYAQMKKRMLPFLSHTPQNSATFIECALPPPVYMPDSCIIEFTGKNGSAIKIIGLTAPQLQPIVSMLLGD